MYKEIVYTLKIWLTALLVSPVIIAFCDQPGLNGFGLVLPLLLFGGIFGLIFSFPSAFILWLATYFTFRYSEWNIALQKAIWSLVGVGLSVLPFFLLEGHWTLQNEKVPYSLIYAAVIVAGIWFYNLTPHDTAEPETK